MVFLRAIRPTTGRITLIVLSADGLRLRKRESAIRFHPISSSTGPMPHMVEAHVQAGAEYQVLEFLGLSVSGYDLAPWGSQTIFSRVVTKGTPPPGAGGRGPVFGQANQTTGGAGIAADSGFSVGADISPGSLVDFSLGYSHSVQLNLDTFSFGIGVNMSRLLRRVRSGS